MRLRFILLFVIPLQVFAQDIDGEIELGGFILGQYRDAVHNELGAPIQKEITDDKWIYEFHKLKADTSVYGLFKYPSWDTTRIYSIQIVGDKFEEMHPFRGIKLGTDVSKLEPIFGKVDHTKQVEDPALSIHYYKDKNYSFDIDPQGKVVGIQIFGNILANKPIGEPSIKPFQNAILSKNIDSLLTYIAPDMEFMIKGREIPYSGAARKEFQKPDGEFMKLLMGEKTSVWYVFNNEKAEGGPGKRLDAKTGVTHLVQDFFDSSVISEIVYTRHAGKWKIFEVRFR